MVGRGSGQLWPVRIKLGSSRICWSTIWFGEIKVKFHFQIRHWTETFLNLDFHFILNHLAQDMKTIVFEDQKDFFFSWKQRVFLMFPWCFLKFQVSVCCLHPGDLLLFLGQSCHAGCNGAAQMSLSLFHGTMPLSYMLQGAFGAPYQLMARKMMSWCRKAGKRWKKEPIHKDFTGKTGNHVVLVHMCFFFGGAL